MTRIGDSERALRRQAAVVQVIAALAIVATGVWAVLLPPAPVVPRPSTPNADAPDATVAGIDAAGWQVALWRPFTDAPPPQPKAVPLTLKLFSLLRQGDGLTAAIDPGTPGGLVYAKVGQRVGDSTVTAIDERGIEVETNGRRQRVELRP